MLKSTNTWWLLMREIPQGRRQEVSWEGGWGCTEVRRLVSGCFSPAEGLVWEGEGVSWVAKHRKLRGSNNLETVNEILKVVNSN